MIDNRSLTAISHIYRVGNNLSPPYTALTTNVSGKLHYIASKLFLNFYSIR